MWNIFSNDPNDKDNGHDDDIDWTKEDPGNDRQSSGNGHDDAGRADNPDPEGGYITPWKE